MAHQITSPRYIHRCTYVDTRTGRVMFLEFADDDEAEAFDRGDTKALHTSRAARDAPFAAQKEWIITRR